MKFINFISNEKIKEQLACLAESCRIPHAIIIEGDEGMGKRTLAREIAINLFCRSDDTPCMKCPQCSKVLKGIHPDLYEYTAANRRDAFHVKRVREIREDAYVKPNEADYKVYILGNAQSMSISAQNALLKVLEEPPSYAVFILTVTNKSAMLETVLSRSVVLTVSPVETSAGAEYISSKEEDVTFDEAYRALEIWGGNIGKAIESLTDGKLAEIGNSADMLAKSVIADNEYELLKVCSRFSWDNAGLSAALKITKTIFRDALFMKSKPVSNRRETAEALSSRLSREKLVKLIDVCDELIVMADRNANNSLLITKTCADLRKASGR